MASIYIRKDSPFVWIKGRSSGKRIQQATKFRKKIALDVRRARALAAEMTAAELRSGCARQVKDGWRWVDGFLKTTYGGGNRFTYTNYTRAWRFIAQFLKENDIRQPAHLLRRHCSEFLAWRTTGALGVRACKQGTALNELAVLRLIMTEAMEREMVNGNPCVGLRIRRSATKRKPELTDQQCAKIREEIRQWPNSTAREMLFYSFEISRYQGCRLMATRVNPQTDVEFFEVKGPDGNPIKSGRITLWNKGRFIQTVLHPALVPMFERLKQKGRTYTWQIPKDHSYTWASGVWWRFLSKIGLKSAGVTIHCNRVTVSSELLRSDVPERKAMEIVGHLSRSSHRGYQRVRVEDLALSIAQVGNTLPDNPETSLDESASTPPPDQHQNNEPSAGTRPPA